MRVALVCDWFLPRMGGIELHLRDLALALQREGIDARIVTTTRGPDVVDGVPVVRLPLPLAPGAGFAISPRIGSLLDMALRDGGFDVVHAHASVVSPAAYAGALSGARAALPTVLTFHSMLYRASMMLGASSTLFGWNRGILLSAVSSVVAAQAVRWMPSASVAVLPNGVDTAFWRGANRTASAGDVHYVSAMRLSRKKRPLALVRAFADAVAFVAGTPALTLTIAGDGPDRASLVRLAAERGVADRVRLPGYLSREALRDLYAAADVFVLPSERESFGIAALEARAAGLPVVAMLESGARDFITPGVNGLLARDEPDLSRSMARLAVDAPLRAYIASRNSAPPSEYAWSSVARQHLTLYDAAVALRDASNVASHA